MEKKIIYSLKDINEFSDEVKDKSILCIIKNIENTRGNGLFLNFDSNNYETRVELQNKILSIGDILYDEIKKDKNISIKILGGDILINNYLIIIANILKIEIYIENIKLQKFVIGIDKEEIKIYNSILKDEINAKEYNLLPNHWKSIYYINKEKIVISKFWKGIIKNA